MVVDLETRRQTVHFARRAARVLAPGDAVVLTGALGVGKTFFTRALGRALGVDRRVRITSPTFALVQEYETAHGRLVHADLYRLRDEPGAANEVARLDLGDARARGAILVAEWAEGFEDRLGDAPALHVHIARIGTTRRATVSGAKVERL
jgi:tRNA threonylcarbamoyladenosine biosynthesis protein TsaE